MYILGIETTGAFASVALMKDDELIGHVHGNDRFSHLQNLMPQVEAVVKGIKLSIGDIDVIAVSRGPGSFTGIRIGVSSARALSQMLDIPCVAVSSLEGLAMRAAEQVTGARGNDDFFGSAASEASPYVTGLKDNTGEGMSAERNGEYAIGAGTLICPMLDARRSQIYAGGYFLENGYPVEKIKAGPYMLDEFLSKTEEYHRILLLGDAIDTYGEKIKELRPEGTLTAPGSIRYQDAVSIARLGAKAYGQEGGLSYNQVEPDYMRLAEAERKLREKQQRS